MSIAKLLREHSPSSRINASAFPHPPCRPPLPDPPPQAYPPLWYLLLLGGGDAQKGGSVLVRSSFPRHPCLVIRRYQKPSARVLKVKDPCCFPECRSFYRTLRRTEPRPMDRQPCITGWDTCKAE